MSHRAILIWAGLVLAMLVPVVLAGFSPWLAYREPLYIVAGFAGIVALALMVLQPLLAGGVLPGLPAPNGRRFHRAIGGALLALVIAHVVGLWITTPPDIVDALLFRSPAPFAAWGVMAMWAVFASALLAAMRKRWRITPRVWRRVHSVLAIVIVVGTAVHAVLIEGAMEFISKVALCVLVLVATAYVMARLKAWKTRTPSVRG